MRRWNGWGDESNSMELPASGLAFLKENIGASASLAESDATLEAVMEQVPASRLPDHSLIHKSAELRVRHARGQSLPDWLACRSGQIEHFPDGVAFPETKEECSEIVNFCYGNDIILIPYGGGTSVVGHINPFQSDKPILTVSLSRMNRLMDFDDESQIATFGAGTPGPMVESQLRAKGYTLGHFPQSFELSTVGGWIVTRSSGQQSLRYGRIEQVFAGGSLETPQGRLEIPTFPASSAGPDIREMVLGSEGRMGILSEVKVRVTPCAQKEDFFAFFFPSWDHARNAARELVQAKVQLSMMRVSNAVETETQLVLAGHEKQIGLLERYLKMRGVGDGKCMLTLGITGSPMQYRAAKKLSSKIIGDFKGVGTGTIMGNRWAENRFRMPYLRQALWDLGYVVDTLETATDWSNVDSLVDKIENNIHNCMAENGEKIHVFTHLSHFYSQGCSIYTTYVYRVGDSCRNALENWQNLKHSTSELIVNGGGTISHQHGVGKDHAPYINVEKGKLGMKLIRGVCKIMDEKGVMNPKSLFDDEVKD